MGKKTPESGSTRLNQTLARHASRMPLFGGCTGVRCEFREFRRGHRGRGRDRVRDGLFPHPRSRLCRLGRGDRARSDLCACRHDTVGRLDPPAVLHAGKHPHERLRRRVLPRPEEPLRRGRRYRLSRARLSAARKRDRRGDAAGQPRDAEGRGRRHRADRSGGARRQFPLAENLGSQARRVRPQRRGLVRRAFAADPAARRRAAARARPISTARSPPLRATARASPASRSPTAAASSAGPWSTRPARRPATSRRSPASRCRSSRASAAFSWSRAVRRCRACR